MIKKRIRPTKKKSVDLFTTIPKKKDGSLPFTAVKTCTSCGKIFKIKSGKGSLGKMKCKRCSTPVKLR